MLRKILSAIILAGIFTGTVASPIHTARGTVDIKQIPKKVAVYDVGVIDTLDALGVPVAGAPEKLYTNILAEKIKSKAIGTLFEPNLEALAALKPDLIIVALRTAKQYDSVKRIAPTIDLTLDNKNAFNETIQRTKDLGKLFGKEAKAKAIVDKLTRIKDETKAAAKDQGKVLVIMVNAGKLSIFDSSSRIGFLESSIGLKLMNKQKDPALSHGDPISFEYIAKENPDWIFVVDRGVAIGEKMALAKDVLNTPLVKNTTAGKKGQIVYLSPAEVYIDVGGPQALEKTLTEVRDALKAHPAGK